MEDDNYQNILLFMFKCHYSYLLSMNVGAGIILGLLIASVTLVII